MRRSTRTNRFATSVAATYATTMAATTTTMPMLGTPNPNHDRVGNSGSNTVTTPADPLIGYYDYGSSLTLNDGDSLTVDFSAANGVLQIA